MLFGIVQKGNNKWEGTKIHVKGGSVGSGKFVVPYGLLHLFKEKASSIENWSENLSFEQAKLIRKEVEKLGDNYFSSEQFEAMEADIRMFGSRVAVGK